MWSTASRRGCAAANAVLKDLAGRPFSVVTVRAYAFDVLNLARFLIDRDLGIGGGDAGRVDRLAGRAP